MTKPPTCPTPCGQECGEDCHETHAPSWTRSHRPDDCPSFRDRARHWLFGGPVLLVPLPEPLPSIDETMQQVINNLAARGIRLVVPGFDTPPRQFTVNAVAGQPDSVWVFHRADDPQGGDGSPGNHVRP